MTVYRTAPPLRPLDYGPELPLEDDERDRGLRDLLQAGGLVALDVSATVAADKPITLHPYYEGSWFSILGVTSRNARNEVEIDVSNYNDLPCIKATDAAAFNLGHLIPIDAGVISNIHPLRIAASCISGDNRPQDLSLTFWGQTLSQASLLGYPVPSSYGFPTPPRRMAVHNHPFHRRMDLVAPAAAPVEHRGWRPALLFSAIRLLRLHKVPLDSDLQAFADRYRL